MGNVFPKYLGEIKKNKKIVHALDKNASGEKKNSPKLTSSLKKNPFYLPKL
jgi:hypothetical protein